MFRQIKPHLFHQLGFHICECVWLSVCRAVMCVQRDSFACVCASGQIDVTETLQPWPGADCLCKHESTVIEASNRSLFVSMQNMKSKLMVQERWTMETTCNECSDGNKGEKDKRHYSGLGCAPGDDAAFSQRNNVFKHLCREVLHIVCFSTAVMLPSHSCVMYVWLYVCICSYTLHHSCVVCCMFMRVV